MHRYLLVFTCIIVNDTFKIRMHCTFSFFQMMFCVCVLLFFTVSEDPEQAFLAQTVMNLTQEVRSPITGFYTEFNMGGEGGAVICHFLHPCAVTFVAVICQFLHPCAVTCPFFAPMPVNSCFNVCLDRNLG